MQLKAEKEIMAAIMPSEIFTMDVDTIEEEYEAYLDNFKPMAYNNIRNFVVTQKLTLLYRKALNQLSDKQYDDKFEYMVYLTDEQCNKYSYEYHYVYDIKLGKMYVTEENIIFLIGRKYKKYYENYIEKASKIPKLNKSVWSRTEYSFPIVLKHFQTAQGDYAIILKKPCKIYPLREILNYFGGKLEHEHVAAIINRLYYFECYMDIIGMQHNGITLDNLFFAPGKIVEEGQSFTIEDMRIVGVYGGWFFTTKSDEQIIGMPKEIYDILPDRLKKRKYSSFEVDELAIKKIARELLGDVSGKKLGNTPTPIKSWVNNKDIKRTAYDEYCSWEEVVIKSYGKKRFVDMDISI